MEISNTHPVDEPTEGFFLIILEHPGRVRSSGYTSISTARSIDPIPIIQLAYRDENGNVITEYPAFAESVSFVVSATLASKDGSKDILSINSIYRYSDTLDSPTTSTSSKPSNTALQYPEASRVSGDIESQPDPSSSDGSSPAQRRPPAVPGSSGTSSFTDPVRAPSFPSMLDTNPAAVPVASQDHHPLFGNTVSPSYSAKDLVGRQGIFFVFGNLCVRLEGIFRLKFKLVHLMLGLNPPLPRTLTTVISNQFESHSWRTFPGMGKISDLARNFVDQGVVKIIRKAQPAKRARSLDEGDSARERTR
ncbi:velvet factor [Polychytrium aggregatum]|uniref:velvet factor n=1 Tax=Polychytrium aggregatum TaxID=110093 RepID=UPI0022FE8704|nr:velvet factor [Polychytrium aggregatum]KAI9199705.1 velvet factor [Polychytrium aggregatum]